MRAPTATAPTTVLQGLVVRYEGMPLSQSRLLSITLDRYYSRSLFRALAFCSSSRPATTAMAAKRDDGMKIPEGMTFLAVSTVPRRRLLLPQPASSRSLFAPPLGTPSLLPQHQRKLSRYPLG